MIKHAYFTVARKMCESPIWLAEPFTRGQAWIDLIYLANYKPGHIRKRGVKVEIPRGGVGWSERELSLRWKWSRGKLRRFMADLATGQRIVPQKNNVTSCFFLVNYDEYQPTSTTDRTTNGTTDGPQTVPEVRSKEVKKVKKESKDRGANGRFAPPSLDEIIKYGTNTNRGTEATAEAFRDHFESNGWRVGGKTQMKSWEAAYRGWCRREQSFSLSANQPTANHRRKLN